MLNLAHNLKLPTQIATQAISVLGIRSSGKTNTAGALAEELLAIDQPVVVVDPTDAWWGLRSSADGKQAGYGILICGGSHGDLVLGENDGKALAEFLVAEQVSAILSIRHLRKEAQRRFFVALAEELYHLKGRPENRSALTLVIDEASSFVPQDVRGDVARSAGAVEDVVNRGRNAGFGVVLINQRAATLNKNVLTQCDTLVIHRMPSPQDRKAIMGWIEENATDEQAKEVLGSLASLKTGEAWIWSPALDVCQRTQIRLKRTFDSSRTPAIGEAPRQPKKLAEVDLDQLKTRMASSIELAKANDPKLLKARISELEKQVYKSAHSLQPPDDKALERAAASAVRQAEAAWLGEKKELSRKLVQAEKVLAQIAGLAGRTSLLPAENLTHQVIGSKPGNIPVPVKKIGPPAQKIGKPVSDIGADAGSVKLGKGEQAVLTAFYWLAGEAATPAKVSFYSAYSQASSTWDRILASLRKAGLVTGWSITSAGSELVQSWGVDPKPTGSVLRDWLRPRLTPSENKVLDVLIERHPDRLTTAELAEASGLSSNSSTWDRTVATLRKVEAAEGYEKDGGLKAADVLVE